MELGGLTLNQAVQASQLADRYRSGDRTVGERLAIHVRASLVRRFYAMGLFPHDVEDLVQECSALVFEAIHSYDSTRGSFDSWLGGYARNVARSWWRGHYSRRQSEQNLDAIGDIFEARGSVTEGGALEEALKELSLIDQELLQMRFGMGYSFDEIVARANITSVNARKRVSRAVEVLRRNPALRNELGLS